MIGLTIFCWPYDFWQPNFFFFLSRWRSHAVAGDAQSEGGSEECGIEPVPQDDTGPFCRAYVRSTGV